LADFQPRAIRCWEKIYYWSFFEDVCFAYYCYFFKTDYQILFQCYALMSSNRLSIHSFALIGKRMNFYHYSSLESSCSTSDGLVRYYYFDNYFYCNYYCCIEAVHHSETEETVLKTPFHMHYMEYLNFYHNICSIDIEAE